MTIQSTKIEIPFKQKEKAFNVRSQKAYDKLMIELSKLGYRWLTHEYYEPIEIDYFYKNGRNTLIYAVDGSILYDSLKEEKETPYKVFKPSDCLSDQLEII